MIVLLAACKGGDDPTTQVATGPVLVARPPNPTCTAPVRPLLDADVALEPLLADGVEFYRPIQALQPPDRPDTWWVVEQPGRIRAFTGDGADAVQVLDITPRVDDSGNEMGLLSIAFHPDWAQNREVFLSYTAPGPLSVLARYRSTDGGATIDPSSEEVVLTVDQPFTNHNGGLAAFGPDGYLYFGLGDGGSGGDPLGSGQDTGSLLGKMLRIDVDGGGAYAIPPDNPFAQGGGRPEIYAWGLRNPWRWSFDRATGELWLGDVGQDEIEEIDVVQRGGNYGWNVMEGDECYSPSVDCDQAGLVLPVATTQHEEGDACVTGGVVYRGTAIPALVGTYLWADYSSGRVYGLFHDPVSGEAERRLLGETGLQIAHVGEDADGEIVIVALSGGIYRVVENAPGGGPEFPATLAETGCFGEDGRPLPSLVPYEVAHPFWSDGADKLRWLAVPDGTTITVEDGELAFPEGSVLVKEFHLGGKRLETRLLVRHTDGNWAGYAYAWDDAGTTATLLPSSLAVTGGNGEPWTIPSRSECLSCHTLATGGTLGMSLAQLDVVTTQSNGWKANQVDELVRLGMLEAPATRGDVLPALVGPESVEERARAYLDVNCSFCHFDGGTGGGSMDLRRAVPLAETGLCDRPSEGDLGIRNARIVAPGEPERSVLSSRVRRRDASGMPPLASTVVDEAGADVLDEWITSLDSCP